MEDEQIWSSDSNSIHSSTIGRVMNTLLTSRPRKLEDAISSLSSDSRRTARGSLEEPLRFLWRYVKQAVEKEVLFDQILVPMVESSLRFKDSKNHKQVLILLNWLFRDELLFEALATNLAEIIMRKGDGYISLGWCTLVCELVDEKTSKNESYTGIQERHSMLLRILCPLITHLSSVMCNGSSTLQDGFELPTRLSVSVTDCILVLTEALTKQSSTAGISSIRMKSSDRDATDRPFPLAFTASGEKKMKSTSSSGPGFENCEIECLLWDHLDAITLLVQKLLAWSRRSRPLHAKGLEQVFKWMQKLKGLYGSIKDEGVDIIKTRGRLLSSCWKHCCKLLRLEDPRFSQNYIEMLNQYISGIQFYSTEYTDEHPENKDGGTETRKFFLNCICLLLGRLNSKQFEFAMLEHGPQIHHILLSQLQCADIDVIEGAASILRAIVFRRNDCFTRLSPSDSAMKQMEAVFPVLLNLLDERDTTARAVVMLSAEYCCINTDGLCLQEVFKRLASESLPQRRNAIDVITEILRISSDSGNSLSLSMRQDMVRHLVDRCGDEELEICKQASNLLSTLDPPLVVPELVQLVYSLNKRVQSSASNALITVLICHNQNPDVIVMLLDCLSKLCQGQDLQKSPHEVEGQKLNSDLVLKLIPEWAKSVHNWDIFIEPLIDKMFAEPSNATIVRFLGNISENLANNPNMVLNRVLSRMQEQEEMDEKLLSEASIYRSSSVLEHHLFNRLCPLLIIRMLPLRVFNDLNSSVTYGQLLHQSSEKRGAHCTVSVCGLLLKRAFNKFEFEDVRKLAAELCGRIHPKVLFPVICTEFEHATHSRDLLKMKACLFAVCTSLVLRGNNSVCHPALFEIRKILETVLLWPSMDGEVSKAQHGCIDCLALMICAELGSPPALSESIVEEKSCDAGRNSAITYVLQELLNTRSKSVCITELDTQMSEAGSGSGSSVPLSFRLCMANALISACQKIPSSGKKPLAERVLPVLLHSVKAIMDSDVRAACMQVLFSSVYHLKTAVLPYTFDLLKLSVKALKRGSHEEKMGSVKLMAALMAIDDAVLRSILGGLVEARLALSTVSLKDPSPELRQICKELLTCMTTPFSN